MNKCSPVEMRKNLELVDLFKNTGIDFVAVPVRNHEHKQEMIDYVEEVLQEMIDDEEG